MFKDKRIMTVLAHPDDETLGCGGTLYKYRGQFIHCLIPVKRIEKQHKKAMELLGIKSWSFGNFKDNRMDSYCLADVSRFVENAIVKYKPEIIITHHSNCTNQDHRVLYEACSIATRPAKHKIPLLTCEVMSSTGYLRPCGFEPNYYVSLTLEEVEKKMEAVESYKTELRPDRSPVCLASLAKIRGAESGNEFAEGFMIVRAYE